MKIQIALLALLAFTTAAQAADTEAGKARATSVCAACHGGNGVSVATFIPNLAAQRPEYIVSQLEAFKASERKDDLMSAIASQLDGNDMENVAAYFAGLPGATAGAAPSALLPAVAETHVGFPANYRSSFTKYLTMNFPESKQLRYFYANPVAMKAAGTGEPLPDGSMILVEVYSARLDEQGNPVQDSDGFFAPGELKGYAAMERQAGWGAVLPEMLRNENWNYAPFTTEKVVRSGFNQAVCFACHKPRAEDSNLFTMKELQAAAKSR
jgi:cytochrome c553